jgi:hypothetical protein
MDPAPGTVGTGLEGPVDNQYRLTAAVDDTMEAGGYRIVRVADEPREES